MNFWEFPLGAILGYLAGHIILIVSNFLLPSSEAFWENEFGKSYPQKKWIPFIFPIFYIAGFFGFASIMGKTLPYVHFESGIADAFYFVFWVVTGVGIASGLLEVLTGVSPLPQGSRSFFKAPWLHQYRYNPQLAWRARVIGGLRILLGIFFLFLLFVIGNLSLI
ncbi:MAG: hypothetical protein JW963_14275 [Anaerolineales bacterium]|nr:hypothetical protein [Anaerolineales bacterium]